MKISEIYEKFDKIGCLSFTTINENNEPESRIAHLRGYGYDDDGICKIKCSFIAIKEKDNKYEIDKTRCDECGDCFINCPVKAIS